MVKDVKYKRTEDAVMRQVAGEWILVPIAGDIADMNKLLTTNDVGASVWSLIASEMSLQEICDGVCAEFDVPSETALADASAFIAQLGQSGLLASVSE